MILSEGTWSTPNDILLLFELNSLKYKKVRDLTNEDRSLLYRVCGSDLFFDDLDTNPQENVWGLICMYLDDCNDHIKDWRSDFYKLKYYDNYGWAFEDKRQCFVSLFGQ